MGNQADRLRDAIELVASGDLAAVVEQLDQVGKDFQSHADTSARLLLNHNGEFVKVWDEIAEHGDSIVALSNRIQTATDLAVDLAHDVRQDLDDLRAEMLERIAEATATPFDPRPE